MRKLFLVAAFFAIGVFCVSGNAFSADRVLFGFEEDAEGWEIPNWAFEQPDSYIGEEVISSNDFAIEGNSSLKLLADFRGGRWYGAITEVMEYFDWTPYKTLSCDIYLPKGAPKGLKTKIILTVGDKWRWTEMSRTYKLKPGEWNHLSVNLKPGSEDWKKTKVDDKFRSDIRKIAIRIESSQDTYKGPIYIDNIVLSE